MPAHGRIDVERIIGEVAARHNILLRPDDPAFAIVTINQLVLEKTADQIAERVRTIIGEFENSVQNVETRAGKIIGREVRQSAAEIRAELNRDIVTAGAKAAELVARVDRAHSRPALVRWIAAGLVSAATLFGAGLWIGISYVR